MCLQVLDVANSRIAGGSLREGIRLPWGVYIRHVIWRVEGHRQSISRPAAFPPSIHIRRALLIHTLYHHSQPPTTNTAAISYSATSAHTFLVSSPASPNAFSLFRSTQSPQYAYNLYEDARQVLGSSNGRTSQRKTTKSGLKKYFGL